MLQERAPRVLPGLLARSGSAVPSGAAGRRGAAPALQGEVPQLFPAERPVYTLDEDMALNLGITVVRSGYSRERTLARLPQKRLPALS